MSLSLAYCMEISNAAFSYIAETCNQLQEINLEGCPNITSEGLTELFSKYKALKALNIGKTPVNDSLFSVIPDVEELSIASTLITDEGIDLLI